MVVISIVLKHNARKYIMVSLHLFLNRPSDGPITVFRLYLFFVCGTDHQIPFIGAIESDELRFKCRVMSLFPVD